MNGATISAIKIIILRVSIYTMLWFLQILSIGIIDQPYDFLIINWLLSICLFGASRIIIRWLLQSTEGIVKIVLIYGAGSAGIQLNSAIEYNPNYELAYEKKASCYI